MIQQALKLLHEISLPVANHGAIYIVAMVLPVYWRQDFKFKNSGYDTLSLWNETGSYCRGTVGGRNAFFRCHS